MKRGPIQQDRSEGGQPNVKRQLAEQGQRKMMERGSMIREHMKSSGQMPRGSENYRVPLTQRTDWFPDDRHVPITNIAQDFDRAKQNRTAINRNSNAGIQSVYDSSGRVIDPAADAPTNSMGHSYTGIPSNVFNNDVKGNRQSMQSAGMLGEQMTRQATHRRLVAEHKMPPIRRGANAPHTDTIVGPQGTGPGYAAYLRMQQGDTTPARNPVKRRDEVLPPGADVQMAPQQRKRK